MSFSFKVKEELSEIEERARHCKIAELAAIILFCGRIRITENERYRLILQTENFFVIKKFYDLVKGLLNIGSEVSIRQNQSNKSRLYMVALKGEEAKKLLLLMKLLNRDGEIRGNMNLVSTLVVQKNCCKRAFIRGAFLSAGSITDPEKDYHFEIVTMNKEKALGLQEMFDSIHITSKIVKRKNYYPVYVKEGEQLADLLVTMGATNAFLKYENIRIVKDVRNRVNRTVNCETANLKKTASAAAKQLMDIEYIRDNLGLSKLPRALSELAEVRLIYQEASLKELGNLLEKPLGKSGVNHRLNKISEIADKIREQKGEI